MTLLAEDLPPVACLCCFPPSPRCLLNPREVASEGGGGKGQNSDLRRGDYLHLVISLLLGFAFAACAADFFAGFSDAEDWTVVASGARIKLAAIRSVFSILR